MITAVLWAYLSYSRIVAVCWNERRILRIVAFARWRSRELRTAHWGKQTGAGGREWEKHRHPVCRRYKVLCLKGWSCCWPSVSFSRRKSHNLINLTLSHWHAVQGMNNGSGPCHTHSAECAPMTFPSVQQLCKVVSSLSACWWQTGDANWRTKPTWCS